MEPCDADSQTTDCGQAGACPSTSNQIAEHEGAGSTLPAVDLLTWSRATPTVRLPIAGKQELAPPRRTSMRSME
ncbi:MAG: hypothetical protein MI807_09600, partial [Verrucomicrobiales bacterium]|nr:hypothetical protein [Verrucomicrobiales bacterium]